MPLNTGQQMFPIHEQRRSQPTNPVLAPNAVREQSQHREGRSRSNSSSRNRRPLRPQLMNRNDASSLKIEVPNTLASSRPTTLKHQTSQSTLDDQENGHAVDTYIKQEPSQRPSNRSTFPMSAQSKDDTTDITAGEDGWDEEGSESGEPTAMRMPQTQGFNLGPDWQREADAERQRQGVQPVYLADLNSRRQSAHPQPNDDTISTFEEGDDEDYNDDFRNLEKGTPSRAALSQVDKRISQQLIKQQLKFAPSVVRNPTLPDRRRQSSPILPVHKQPVASTLQQNHQSSIARHTNYKQHVDAIEPALAMTKPVAASSARTTLKVSSFHEPSEDEQPAEGNPSTSATATKRSFAEIDYDLENLKSQTYADLDAFEFLRDPREPDAAPAVDVNGAPIPLFKKLENLSKLPLDAQQTLFQTLTDEENEQAGQWFVQTFQNELKKLMERRLERRKIALTYEHEVKRREAIVQVKISDVDEELKDLRKGCGQLIGGKIVTVVGGTPKGK